MEGHDLTFSLKRTIWQPDRKYRWGQVWKQVDQKEAIVVDWVRGGGGWPRVMVGKKVRF